MTAGVVLTIIITVIINYIIINCNLKMINQLKYFQLN